MNTISHTDEAAKKIVEKFCGQVFWLRDMRHVYKELFESEFSQILMEKTAPSFFTCLSRILQSYLLLEFAKITDPASTKVRDSERENFTVENLIVSINWPEDIKDKLTALLDRTKDFRSRVFVARNKLLAHLDKEAFLNDKIIGVFPEGEDEVFLETLQEVCDVTHEACFGTIFGVMVFAKPGDVIDFRRALENAVAFNELLSESSGEEKTRLYSCLQKAKRRSLQTQDKPQKDNGALV